MERRIKVGIDYDGVLVERAKPWNLMRKVAKIGSVPMDEAKEGVAFLKDQPDIDILGIYTARHGFIMRIQTQRQLRRMNIPIEKVVYTSFSYQRKLTRLLEDSISTKHHDEQNINKGTFPKVVLIDDRADRVIAEAKKLIAEQPHMRELFDQVILVAYNPRNQEQMHSIAVPNFIHILTMKSWVDIKKIIDEIRNL